MAQSVLSFSSTHTVGIDAHFLRQCAAKFRNDSTENPAYSMVYMVAGCTVHQPLGQNCESRCEKIPALAQTAYQELNNILADASDLADGNSRNAIGTTGDGRVFTMLKSRF